MMRGQELSRSKRFVFVAVMLVIGWVICELGAYLICAVANRDAFYLAGWQRERRRIKSDEEVTIGESGFTQAVVPHPYIGYVYDWNTTPNMSPYGWLDVKEMPHKEDGKLVVAVVGGSVAQIFGIYGMPHVATWLEQQFDREVVTVNLAIVAQKQPQQLHTLAYLLTQNAEFDILLNIDGFNEIACPDWREGVHPTYPRLWYELSGIEFDRQRLILIGKLEYARRVRDSIDHTHAYPPLRYSPLCNVVWKWRRTRTEQTIAVLREEIETSAPSTRVPAYALGPTHTGDAMTTLVATWHQGSIQLQHLCRANNIQYFHFLQPNQYVPGSKTLTPEEKRFAYNPNERYQAAVVEGYPKLQEAGKDLANPKTHGICFTDLTQIFADSSETLYRDTCCHFNESGNQIMAQRVIEVLESNLQLTEHPLTQTTH